MQKLVGLVLPAALIVGCANQVTRAPIVSQLEMDGVLWLPVKSLENSSPNDQHYSVRTEEDGTSVIEFGDGEHGARPPAGTRTIRLRYSGVRQQQGRILQGDCK